MVEEGDEIGNRPFKIYVVFPERIVSVDEKGLGFRVRHRHFGSLTDHSNSQEYLRRRCLLGSYFDDDLQNEKTPLYFLDRNFFSAWPGSDRVEVAVECKDG